MRLELTGRHVDIGPMLRRLVDTKLARLERLLNDSAVSAQVVLTREKYRCRAEITLHARGEKFLHGVGDSSAWESSVARAIDKIAQQAHKVKGKWQARKRRGVGHPRPAGDARRTRVTTAGGAARERVRLPRTFRAARQAVLSMSVAEALRAMDSNGDGVIVFRDPERAAISVLYRRQDGDLTLIETEG